MDIIKGENKLNCKDHPNKEIEFIQINDTLNQQEDINLFYCNFCVNDDPNFQHSNYQLIQQILEQGSTHIIKKWPPISDSTVTTKLANILSKNKSNKSISDQVINYFSDLKIEILNKIDLVQKKTINQISEQNLDNSEILKRYQEISKIVELRTLLLNEQRYSFEIQQEECSKFIKKVEANKITNTKLLQDLLFQSQQKQNQINLEFPKLIKENILNSLDQINFFNQENNILTQNNKKIELIMNLVSNRSNKCQGGFLQQLQQQLQGLNPFIQSLSIENAFLENQQPIDFNEFDNKQLDFIENYAKHTIQWKNNNEYHEKIKTSFQIKQINQLINNKFNFASTDFKEEFEKYLIDTFSFLNCVNLTDMIEERNKFEFFKDISEELLNDIFKLFKRRQVLDKNNNMNNSQSQIVIQQLKNMNYLNFKAEDIHSILRKYPIFDLIDLQVQQNNNQTSNQNFSQSDILSKIQLVKPNANILQNRLLIHKNQNNNYEIQNLQNQGQWQACIANIKLEKENKYIFRMKIESLGQGDQVFSIGLNNQSQTNEISAYLFHSNKFIQKRGNQGISQLLKGKEFKVSSSDNLLEMRVHLKEQLLEILDFPNYQFKLGVNQNFKQYLGDFSECLLQISIYQGAIKLILMGAFIVNEFFN